MLRSFLWLIEGEPFSRQLKLRGFPREEHTIEHGLLERQQVRKFSPQGDLLSETTVANGTVAHQEMKRTAAGCPAQYLEYVAGTVIYFAVFLRDETGLVRFTEAGPNPENLRRVEEYLHDDSRRLTRHRRFVVGNSRYRMALANNLPIRIPVPQNATLETRFTTDRQPSRGTLVADSNGRNLAVVDFTYQDYSLTQAATTLFGPSGEIEWCERFEYLYGPDRRCLLQTRIQNGSTINQSHFTYDSLGNAVREERHLLVNGQPMTLVTKTEYKYDRIGNWIEKREQAEDSEGARYTVVERSLSYS